MKDIELISFNVKHGDRFNNDRVDDIKIHYRTNFDKPTPIKVFIGDYIFQTETQFQKLELGSALYWSQFSSKGSHVLNNYKQNTIPYIGPQKLTFINDNTNEIINEFKLDIKFVDYSLRGRSKKRNAWIIGDSHIGHLSNELNYNDLEYEKIRINPLCRLAVTMSRFYKSDYIEYLSYFPIEDDDILLFNLGEIDTRMAIHVKSHNKGLRKKDILNGIILNYVNSIKEVSKKYHKNKIVFLRPNLPVNDKHILDDNIKNQYLRYSNENDRKDLNDYLCDFLKSFTETEKNIFYVDNSIQYQINGFADNSLLIHNDIHMKTNKQYFDSLYDKIKDL